MNIKKRLLEQCSKDNLIECQLALEAEVERLKELSYTATAIAALEAKGYLVKTHSTPKSFVADKGLGIAEELGPDKRYSVWIISDSPEDSGKQFWGDTLAEALEIAMASAI